MARQYVVTDAEFDSLLDRLTIARMKSENISDPERYFDDAWRKLSDHEKANMRAAVESLNRGMRMVVVRWIQEMGATGIRGNHD